MEEGWEENFDAPVQTFQEEGRSYGKGRGFLPPNNDSDHEVGNKNGFKKFGDSEDDDFGNGFGGRGGGSRGGRDGGKGGYRSRNDDDDDFGGSKRFGDDNGGGFRGRSGGRGGGRGGFRGRNNDEEGDDFGGGRGGFRGRNNDEDGDDFGGGRRGGYRSRNDDDGGSGGGYRGRGRGGGRGGGYKSRNNDDDDDFGGGGDDDANGGGYRSRGRGGGRGGGGGFRSRNNDDDDDFGGGGDDNGGGYRGRGRGGGRGGRGGGFRSRNNDDDDGFGGGGGGDDDDDNGGGYRGRGRGGGRGGGFRSRNNDDDDDFGGGGDDRKGGYKSRGGRDQDGGGQDSEEKEKPPPYVPPEPSNEDSDIFGSGVEMGINFDKYDNIDIKVSGDNVPKPIETFEQAGLRELVLENIKKSGYTKPTPVQKHALPIIMQKRDLMACAQTGSGKTAAFLVPIVNTLLANPVDLVVDSTHTEPQVVIVSPTRELTIQIYEQARKFSRSSILKCVVAYGGTSAGHQSRIVLGGCHILVATPGRLMDFVGKGRVTFSSVRFFVLDEADRMLDMGFLPEIEKMMDHETMVRCGERLTLMFSATFPEEIQRLAARFLHEYLFLAVGIVGGACSDVEQNFHQVSKFQKRAALKDLMEKETDTGIKRTLVFVEMKRTADFIAAFLSENNYPTTSIHGDRLQREREEALMDFKCGKMSILVATAVAARGLDIKNVGHVVNYDMPKSIDEYVHRIGRTGRVGNRGKATSFFDPDEDGALVSDLVKILRQAEQPIPDWLESGGESRSFAPGRTSKFGGRDVRNFGKQGNDFEPYPDNAHSGAAEPEEEW